MRIQRNIRLSIWNRQGIHPQNARILHDICPKKYFLDFWGIPLICPLPPSLMLMTLARLALPLEHFVQFAVNEAAKALNCNKNFQGAVQRG